MDLTFTLVISQLSLRRESFALDNPLLAVLDPTASFISTGKNLWSLLTNVRAHFLKKTYCPVADEQDIGYYDDTKQKHFSVICNCEIFSALKDAFTIDCRG